MSDDVTGVLDSIDNALDDWAVSDDAMRWTPEAAAIAPPPPRLNNRFATITFNVVMEAMEKFAASLAKMVKPIERVLARIAERTAAAQHQPIPLRIDGHEYRRRRRHR